MSKNKKELFCGVATAIITPFFEGKIDYKAFENLLDFQIEGSVKTIVVAGTTGEASSLSYGELEELFSFACRHTKGRAKIIAGCGCNNTERSVEVAQTAEWCGCHGLLAVTPYYNRPTSLGLVRHYESLADAVNLPLILYNVPSRTGTGLGVDVCRELSGHPRIVGIKEASGNISFVADILAECGDDLDVYSGNDDMVVPIMALGGRGCISVVSNILPVEMHKLCKNCLDGNFQAAAAQQLDLIPIIRAMFKESNPIPIKYALSHLGFCTPEYRLPLCPPSDETAKIIDEIVDLI